MFREKIPILGHFGLKLSHFGQCSIWHRHTENLTIAGEQQKSGDKHCSRCHKYHTHLHRNDVVCLKRKPQMLMLSVSNANHKCCRHSTAHLISLLVTFTQPIIMFSRQRVPTAAPCLLCSVFSSVCCICSVCLCACVCMHGGGVQHEPFHTIDSSKLYTSSSLSQKFHHQNDNPEFHSKSRQSHHCVNQYLKIFFVANL